MIKDVIHLIVAKKLQLQISFEGDNSPNLCGFTSAEL